MAAETLLYWQPVAFWDTTRVAEGVGVAHTLELETDTVLLTLDTDDADERVDDTEELLEVLETEELRTEELEAEELKTEELKAEELETEELEADELGVEELETDELETAAI
jgi:hypothetical protein